MNEYSNKLLAVIEILQTYPNRPTEITVLSKSEIKQLELYANKHNWDFEIYDNQGFRYDKLKIKV